MVLPSRCSLFLEGAQRPFKFFQRIHRFRLVKAMLIRVEPAAAEHVNWGASCVLSMTTSFQDASRLARRTHRLPPRPTGVTPSSLHWLIAFSQISRCRDKPAPDSTRAQ